MSGPGTPYGKAIRMESPVFPGQSESLAPQTRGKTDESVCRVNSEPGLPRRGVRGVRGVRDTRRSRSACSLCAALCAGLSRAPRAQSLSLSLRGSTAPRCPRLHPSRGAGGWDGACLTLRGDLERGVLQGRPGKHARRGVGNRDARRLPNVTGRCTFPKPPVTTRIAQGWRGSGSHTFSSDIWKHRLVPSKQRTGHR